MWFKNLVVYRLPAGLKLDIPALKEARDLNMQPCGTWIWKRGLGRRRDARLCTSSRQC